MKKIFVILGSIFLLIISAASDLLFYRFESLNEKFSDGLHPVIPWGTETVVYLILGLVLLWLAWLVLYRTSRSYLTAGFLIVLGGIVLFLLSIPGHHIINSIIRFPYALPNQVWSAQPVYTDLVIARFSFARMSAGIVMAIGLLRLLPDKKLWHEIM
jgi:hypothetical protein